MRGELYIVLKNDSGSVIESRHAKNAVMRAGGELIAKLFAGQGVSITHMGVGTNDAPESEEYSTEALSNEIVGETPELQGGTEVALVPEGFTIIENKDLRNYKVKVSGTMPATAAVGTIREAGLIARDDDSAVLYNRVTFAPITKSDDHELTLFWEVTFPYGDLQWF